MPAQLTNEQRDDLQQHGNQPVPVVDPVTNAVYFLVAGDLFERIKSLFHEEPFDLHETYAAQSAAAGQSGWDDPEMDVYDRYDALKPKS